MPVGEAHPMVRAAAVVMFEALGFRVFDACNGVDGPKLLAANPDVGLSLADMPMPGMSGVESIEAARRLRPDLEAVLTSGYADATAVPGQVAVVPKPTEQSDLRATGLASRS